MLEPFLIVIKVYAGRVFCILAVQRNSKFLVYHSFCILVVAGSSCFNSLHLALDYIAFKMALTYSKNVY